VDADCCKKDLYRTLEHFTIELHQIPVHVAAFYSRSVKSVWHHIFASDNRVQKLRTMRVV